ncbi:MAG: nucleotidyltransferase [Lachnospiraceae bacterium]|nr:nucleotidyltransferase [Lachnospiraceae bacterium]
MNKTALVIMAAGMGSRYGGGIKQLEHVGPSGEIIMDYSIYDALQAGFDKVVFITRKDLEEDFKKIIGDRIARHTEVEYVFQELENLPEGYEVPEGRKKPWGTGHAVLSCLGTVKEPFAVINADDYYGREGFVKLHDFLSKAEESGDTYHFCMAGFVLGNTLSDNGVVTRGICKVDGNGRLTNVEEAFELRAEGDHGVGANAQGVPFTLPLETMVSMNMWGFTPGFLNELNKEFVKFLEGVKPGDIKAEYLLPEVVGTLLRSGKAQVDVLRTNDKWFGVTYKEDKQKVVDALRELVDKGVYPERLFD